MDSFIGWIGGKKLLRNKILERFPTHAPTSYIEVFGGAGWVFFAKEKTNKQLEVFNDANSNLINLFRCIKYHREALEQELEFLNLSREVFFDCKAQLEIRGFTDIQRAARYFYLIKMSFGNNQNSFATSKKLINKTIGRMTQIQERLSGVVIENRDFEAIVKTYDKEDALFYLDPPYHGTEKYYEHGFTLADHHRLRTCLGNIKGKFILSYNDDAFIRTLYADYNIEGITRNSTLSAKSTNSEQFAEVIIRNF